MTRNSLAPFLLFLTLLGPIPFIEAAEPDFTISSRRQNDRITFTRTENAVIFEIRSPDGISQAKITRKEPDWPEDVTLRLHLKGLEAFRISNGQRTLHAAVSSGDPAGPVRQWIDQEERRLLTETHPCWMVIRHNKENPSDSVFEIVLPRELLRENAPVVTVDWIDFYRR